MSPVHAFIPTVGATTRNTTAATASLSSVGRTTITVLKSSPVALTSSPSSTLQAITWPKVNPHVSPSKAADGYQDKPHGRGARPSRIVVLFCDDLRVYDNAALSKAAIDASAVSTGVLIPVVMNGLSSAGTTSVYVKELAGQLEMLGSGLVNVRDIKNLSELIRRLDIEAIYMNHSTTKQGKLSQKHLSAHIRRMHNHDASAKQIEIESFWSNCLLSPPSDAHLQSQQQKRNTSRSSMKQIFADIVAQPLNTMIEGTKTPQQLPALPTVLNTGMAFETVKASSGGGDLLNNALKTLSMMDEKRETLVVDKNPDVAVSLKQVLDHGVVSPRTVVKHVHRVMNGLKGRTFSEMVWRTYVCLSACRAAGVRSARTNALAA